MVMFIDYFKTLVKQFFVITRKPKYPDLTKISGSDQNTRIWPKYPDPTKVPGFDQNTRIQPKYPDPQACGGLGDHDFLCKMQRAITLVTDTLLSNLNLVYRPTHTNFAQEDEKEKD